MKEKPLRKEAKFIIESNQITVAWNKREGERGISPWQEYIISFAPLANQAGIESEEKTLTLHQEIISKEWTAQVRIRIISTDGKEKGSVEHKISPDVWIIFKGFLSKLNKIAPGLVSNAKPAK